MAIADDDIGLVKGAAHVGMAFSVTAFVVSVGSSLYFHKSLYNSDDAYIVGALAGAASALLTLWAVIPAFFEKPVVSRHISYFSVIAIFVTLLLLWDWSLTGREGHGYPTFFAILTIAAGIIAYPLLWLRLTWWTVLLASIPGVLIGTGYLMAAQQMAMR